MAKIFIGKDEEVTSVVEQIITAKDGEMVLVIPKNSVLRESIRNFHLIKREADAAKKRVLIESVDEEILALSRASNLRAAHSLFKQEEFRRSFSDIVPGGDYKGSLELKSKKAGRGKSVRSKKEEQIGGEDRISVKIAVDEMLPGEPARKTPPRAEYVPAGIPRRGPLDHFSFRPLIVFGGFVVLFVIGAWAFGRLFLKAELVVTFRKTPWEYEGNFLADKNASKTNAEQNLLPAQLFLESKNLVQLFPASGRANVSEKAKGRITIYNEYSSDPQPLVATTRFVTPDGKIFRLDAAAVVPGAQVKDGKITPSSIDVAVTADKAGADYNIGPVPRLSIPGFKDSPKYDGFYGSLKEAAKGGFVGEKAVATDKDVKEAQAKTEEMLKSSLRASSLSKLPNGFKIFDEASEVKVTKLTANKTTDEKGNFSVFAEGELRVLGFREPDLKVALLTLSNAAYEGGEFDVLQTTYSNISPDLDKGRLNFKVAATASLKPRFEEEGFKNSVLGRTVKEARSIVGGLRDFESGKISLWPSWAFWAGRLPSNPQKITLVVQ